MQRINLKDVLGRAVSGPYGDLVTRRTGQAVRSEIEEMLDDRDTEVAVIDFGTVRCLDLSCADEIVGKLLLQYGSARYFLLVGVDDGHRDALQPVLERHQLAVVAEDRSGTQRLLGSIPDRARDAFDVLTTSGCGGAAADEIAQRLAVPPEAATAALQELCARRLVREGANGFQPLHCA